MPTVILRSRLARAGAVLVVAALLYITAVIWLSDGYGHGLQALAVSAAVGVLVWLLWWRPRAVIAEDGITVRNAWRSHTVRWGAIGGYRTRWGLALGLDESAANRPASTGSADGAPVDGSAASAGEAEGLSWLNVTAVQRRGPIASSRAPKAPAVDDRFISPVQDLEAEPPVFRTHLAADDAAYLLALYAERREEHLRLVGRLRRRAERVAGTGAAGERAMGESAASRRRAGAAAAEPAPAEPAGAADVAPSAVVHRWDAAPIAAACAAALAVVLTTALL